MWNISGRGVGWGGVGIMNLGFSKVEGEGVYGGIEGGGTR